MPRAINGNYALPNTVNPVVTGEVITSDWANATLEDVAEALSKSLDREGRGGMLAPLRVTAGTVSAPSLAFGPEPTTGIYRPGAGVFAVSVLGELVASVTATQATLTVPLSAEPATDPSHVALLSQVTEAVTEAVTEVVEDLAGTGGAGLVGTTDGDTVQEKLDFAEIRLDDSRRVDLRTSNTAAQNATELVQAMQGRYDAGGGTVTLPSGDYNITTVPFNFAGAVTVNVQGQGPRATVLRKSGGGTDPVLSFSSSPGILEVYSKMSGFRIAGNASAPGLRATRLARWVLERVQIDGCSIGFDNIGSLVFNVYDCTIQTNATGYRSQKSVDNIRANLINFYGGQISANTTLGMDIGDAASVNLYGTDLSANGTSGNLSTGAILLRSTMDDETGFANFNMAGGWLEANQGWAFRTEACAGLFVDLRNVIAAGNASGRVADIGAIFQSSISGLIAGSAGDTVNIAAARSLVSGGVIGVLNDTSTRYLHEGVSTSSGERMDARKGSVERHQLATVDYLFGPGDQVGGGAGSSDSVDHFLPGSGEMRFWVGGAQRLRVGSAGVGFNGVAPSRPSIAAAATDAATTQALANDLRTKLRDMGLFL